MRRAVDQPVNAHQQPGQPRGLARILLPWCGLSQLGGFVTGWSRQPLRAHLLEPAESGTRPDTLLKSSETTVATVKALVKPELLAWARNRAKVAVADAARAARGEFAPAE